MPKKKFTGFFLPIELRECMDALAIQNRRSTSAEICCAIELWVRVQTAAVSK